MRKIEEIATLLKNGKWHDSLELAKIQHRFSASFLLLRKGQFDGQHWVIEKEPAGVGKWRYRLTGFDSKYEVKSPYCRACGSTNICVRDDRSP